MNSNWREIGYQKVDILTVKGHNGYIMISDFNDTSRKMNLN